MKVNPLKTISRSGRTALSAALLAALSTFVLGLDHSTQAALVAGDQGSELLIGFDDDNQANAAIQGGAMIR